MRLLRNNADSGPNEKAPITSDNKLESQYQDSVASVNASQASIEGSHSQRPPDAAGCAHYDIWSKWDDNNWDNEEISKPATALELSKEDTEVLKVAACLDLFDPRLISAATNVNDRKGIMQSINSAAERGLIRRSEEGQEYHFSGTKQQQFFYCLIPLSERCQLHASFGRSLLRNLTEEELKLYANQVLLQFQRGEKEISSQSERDSVALTCLQAIQWIVKESDFCSASRISNLGMQMLGPNSWRDTYDLSLALYNASAEVLYGIGDYDNMDILVSTVLRNARCYHDTIRARSTRVLSLNSRYRMEQATEEAFDVLYHLGERKFPNKTTSRHLIVACLRTKRLLRGKTNEMILRMSPMENAIKIEAAQMLTLPNSYYADPLLMFLVSLRLVQLTMQYGLVAGSSVGFAGYSTLLPMFSKKNVRESIRFGRLSLALLDKFGARNYIPRVYANIHGDTFTYQQSLTELAEKLKRAYHVGLQTGDIEFASINSGIYIGMLLSSGCPLQRYYDEAVEIYEAANMRKQHASVVIIGPCLQWMETMMGKSGSPPRLDGPFFREASDFECLVEAKDLASLSIVMLNRSSIAYVFGDYERAAREAEELDAVSSPAYMNPGYSDAPCIHGLALLAVMEGQASRVRRRMLSKVRKELEILKQFSKYNPETCLGKVYLLEAELAALNRKYMLAHEKYLSAIGIFAQFDNFMFKALSYERYARCLKKQGENEKAIKNFNNARTAYLTWGGIAKVQHLEKEIPELQV